MPIARVWAMPDGHAVGDADARGNRKRHLLGLVSQDEDDARAGAPDAAEQPRFERARVERRELQHGHAVALELRSETGVARRRVDRLEARRC